MSHLRTWSDVVLSSYLRSTNNLGGASRKSYSTDEIHRKKGSRVHECSICAVGAREDDSKSDKNSAKELHDSWFLDDFNSVKGAGWWQFHTFSQGDFLLPLYFRNGRWQGQKKCSLKHHVIFGDVAHCDSGSDSAVVSRNICQFRTVPWLSLFYQRLLMRPRQVNVVT